MKTDLIKHLDTIMDWAKSGHAFVLEQAPDVVQQFLRYEMWSTSYLLFASLVFGTIACIFLIKGFKVFTNTDPGDEDVGFFVIFVSSCVIVISLITLIVQSNYILKLHLAPKLVVIEKLSVLLQ